LPIKTNPMKKFSFALTAILLLFVLVRTGFSQTTIVPVDEDTKLITYKDVVAQEGDIPKLYNTAIAWVNANYDNPTEVTRVRDVEDGKIEIRHRFKIYNTDKNGVKSDANIINYTLKLEFKPGRYRYTFTDFTVAAISKYPVERWLDKKNPQYTPACDDYLAQINTTVNDLIKSLKKGMIPKVIKKDEW
jgi:hypothetical protein